jgi:hypothetical protein
VIGIVGDSMNISDIHFDNIKVKMKHSKNLSVKGRIADLSPAEQIETIPQDRKTYWLLLKEAKNVRFTNLTVYDTDGILPEKAVIGCENVTGL